MRILSGYILRQVVKPMGATLGIVLAVLLLERTSNIIESLLGSGGLLSYVPLMLAYVLPQFTSVALPFSLFLGVFLGFQRLTRDSELVAIESSGHGPHNFLATLALLTLLIAALTAISLSFLQPLGRYGSHLLVHTISNLFFQTRLESGVFTHFNDVTIYAKRISPNKDRAEQVFIFSYGADDTFEVVAATGGSLVKTPESEGRQLKLLAGERISGERNTGDNTIAVGSVLGFDNFQSGLDLDTVDEFEPRGQDERELTLFELWRLIDDPPSGLRRSEIRAEFHARVVRILSVFFMPVLAIYLARWRGRVHKGFATVGGFVFLIVFNQSLDFGENLVETSATIPLLGLWLPFMVFAGTTVFLFCWGWLRVESGFQFRMTSRLPVSGEVIPSDPNTPAGSVR